MRSIRFYRRKVEWGLALLYLSLPFLRIGGESALRFDVPTMKLHFFGAALRMEELYFLLLATVLFVALFLFLTLTLGRVWCGWVCPQTVWCDLTGFLEKKKTNRATAHLVVLFGSLAVGFITVCYFISPYEAIPQALTGELGPVATISTLVLAALFYLNFAFVRRTFCVTICPYAKIQGALTDSRSLLVRMDPDRKEECIDCRMCVRACPTGIDIRQGMQISCIMCAECVDACDTVMAKKNRPGLIRFSFGRDGVASWSELFRPVVVIIGLAGLMALSALVYQGFSRSTFDFTVLPHPMEPRLTKDNGVINAFILSVKNRTGEEITLDLHLAGANKWLFSHSMTGPLQVPAGQAEKFPLFVRSASKPPADLSFEIVLTDTAGGTGRVGRHVYFILP